MDSVSFRIDPGEILGYVGPNGAGKATARLHRRAGPNDATSDLEARRLENWRHWQGKLPDNAFILRQIAAVPGK